MRAMREAYFVVAGAGAAGRTIALALARAGRPVTVVDPLQASASSVAAGMLAPAFEALFDPVASSHFALLREALGRWSALAAEIGLPLAREGALAVGPRGEAERWAAGLAALGADARLLSPEAAAVAAPGLPAGAWAAFAPEDWRLDPATALARLQAAAEQHGARFVKGRVVGFEPGRVALEGGACLDAARLVIATGADRGLAAIAPELAALTPIKGHILRAQGPFRSAPVVRAAGVYLCRAQGEAVLGSTMELGSADAIVDPTIVGQLLGAAAPLTAALGPLAWRAAAGVRASTADGLPLVGPAAAPGVILAVGARRNGWLLAPLIAEAVLAVAEGRAPAGHAAGFDPRRLAAAQPR